MDQQKLYRIALIVEEHASRRKYITLSKLWGKKNFICLMGMKYKKYIHVLMIVFYTEMSTKI